MSGFLITGILLKARDRVDAEGQGSWTAFRRYHASRALRLFPVFFLVIAAGLAFGVGSIREAWPWLLSFTTNIFLALRDEWVEGYFHFWTLAIEAQFYVFWSSPAVLFLLTLESGFCRRPSACWLRRLSIAEAPSPSAWGQSPRIV